VVDFAALASEVDRVAPRVVSAKGGCPPFPTETRVRILVLKRLHNMSGEQVEFQLLDRLSFQRFCGLTITANIPDRTTVWNFENRIGAIDRVQNTGPGFKLHESTADLYRKGRDFEVPFCSNNCNIAPSIKQGAKQHSVKRFFLCKTKLQHSKARKRRAEL